jgi:hypothetical protein
MLKQEVNIVTWTLEYRRQALNDGVSEVVEVGRMVVIVE